MIERKTTKQLLAESLIELGKTQSFDKITIQDIASNCGVSVRTFYYHFTDKFDLLTWIYAQQLEENFTSNIDEGYRAVLVGSARLVRGIAQYTVNLAQNTHGRDSAAILMTRHATARYFDYIAKEHGEDALTDKVRFEVEWYNRLTLEIYMKWAEDDAALSPETLADWTLACMPNDLKPLLNG